MSRKARSVSVLRKLSNLAAKKGVRFEHLATEFLLERLAVRLVSEPKLSEVLVFKGGFVGLRVYHSDRYTIDLDAIMKHSNSRLTLELTRKAAEADLDDGVWFRFENQVDLQTQGEYGGIRQVFRAGFGEIPKQLSRSQIIHFDLGIGDPVTPVKAEIDLLLADQEISWLVYPLETIIAEKLHALVDRGDLSSRSKDIFDMATFLPSANARLLHQSIERCFQHRDTTVPHSFSNFVKQINSKTLERGWVSAVASLPNPPEFKPTLEKLISLLKEVLDEEEE